MYPLRWCSLYSLLESRCRSGELGLGEQEQRRGRRAKRRGKEVDAAAPRSWYWWCRGGRRGRRCCHPKPRRHLDPRQARGSSAPMWSNQYSSVGHPGRKFFVVVYRVFCTSEQVFCCYNSERIFFAILSVHFYKAKFFAQNIIF